MFGLLVAVIYLSFISLGLPDSLLGAAWPVMSGELGAPIGLAGVISLIISAGTIVSSLLSDRLTKRFGAGTVTAVSTMLTAAALLLFSFASEFWQLALFAIPYGLGAGGVDAALNNYVALHLKSRHMSWLHCMWGIGASVGPMIMGRALAAGSWQNGYRVISLLQVVLTAVLLFSLPLWKRPEEDGAGVGVTPEHRTLPQLLRIPGVPEVMISFACYSAVEATAGMWAASYCTLLRGIDAQTAAGWASLFYLGITVGRFFSGFLTMKFNDHQMIRGGQAVILLGVVLIFLPAGHTLLFAGLIIVGLGCAPIYPSIIHETPANFGRNLSMSMTGVQMAAAYVGTTLLPPLFGLLAQHITIGLFPWYLLVALVVMTVSSEAMHRKTAAHRAAQQE